MNNRQRAKLDSYQRIGDFNTTNAAIIAGIPEYAPEQGNFNTAVALITGAGGVQQLISVSNAAPAANSKEAMAAALYKIMLRAKVKARQEGNILLANQLDQPITFITAATKTEAVLRATNLSGLLHDNLGTLTNITQADIDTINAAIAAYDSIKNQPVETRQHIKASGTDLLPAGYADADAAADNMYSLLQSYLAGNDAKLVDEFRLCMEIIDTGLRHTIVDFTIVADATGNPVTGADVTDTSNNKTYRSDANGLVHIPTHRNGNFNFTISVNGYQTVSFGADIKKGVQNDFTVRLIAG